MAIKRKTIKPQSPTPQKLSKIKKQEIINMFSDLKDSDKIEIFEGLGIGKKYFTCYICGKILSKSKFHISSDPNCKTGVSRVCKNCLASFAMPTDPDTGIQQQPDKESLVVSLEYADQPYLESVFQASLLEAANVASGKAKDNVYNSYKKNIALPQYSGMRFNQSDMFNGGINSIAFMTEDALPKDKEIIEQFEKNKADVVRLLGYEPFEKEKLTDQPFLYSNLIGLLDQSEYANEDMMRVSSAITIVRSFAQQARIDDMITKLLQDTTSTERNIATIKSLQETKQKISQTITNLAEQSCLSLKHSKNASKGENTITGLFKKLKELNLRDAENNMFDIGTCEGMRQVADISNASIMKQIKLDENDYTEMLSTQREMIKKYQDELDIANEKVRILLRENIDIKNYMDDCGIDYSKFTEVDDILFKGSNVIIPIEGREVLDDE